jgi:cobalt-zinc-cadmium efflux system protein
VASPHHAHVGLARILAAAAVTVLAAAVEMAVARRVGSHFLAADAVHLFAHLGIFAVLLLPRRGSREIREDVLAVLVLLIVLAIAVVVVVVSMGALRRAEAAPRPAALLVSLCGLAANLITAGLFRDRARERGSFRAALAHELSDASLTIAGLLGAAAIAWFGLRWVDPGLSLLIAGWLGVWSGRLLLKRVWLGAGAWDRV